MEQPIIGFLLLLKINISVLAVLMTYKKPHSYIRKLAVLSRIVQITGLTLTYSLPHMTKNNFIFPLTNISVLLIIETIISI